MLGGEARVGLHPARARRRRGHRGTIFFSVIGRPSGRPLYVVVKVRAVPRSGRSERMQWLAAERSGREDARCLFS